MTDAQAADLRKYLREFHGNRTTTDWVKAGGIKDYGGDLGLVWMTPFVRRPRAKVQQQCVTRDRARARAGHEKHRANGERR